MFKSARRVRPYGSAMFGITTAYSTRLPALDAREGFGRARRSRLTAQVEVVTLDSIVGTVEARTDFDARFRPASNRIRRRWERIALGHRDIEAWVRHAGSSR